MRYLLALALLTCWLRGISPGNELTTRYPLETEFRNLCTGVPVLVSVFDDQDRPVESAQVVAFSEDWGVRLPVTGGPFAYTGKDGTASLMLFEGQWWIFAGFGRTFAALHPGKAGFLGKRIVLDSDSATVVLKPSGFLDVVLPSDAHEVFAMEESCSPLVAMPFCGASYEKKLRVHSTDGLQQRLLFVRHPGNDPGFLLTSPPVGASQSLQMSLQDEKLGRMVFDIQDNNDPGGAMVVGIGYPTADVDQGWQITYFPVRGTQEVFVSPGIVDYYLVYFGSDGSGYWFNRKSASIGGGQRVDVRGGGSLKARVLASAGAESQYGINFLLDAQDSFGNILDFYRLAAGAVSVVKIRLLDEASAPIYSTDWEHSSDWLHLRIPLLQVPVERLHYVVDWDLGMFGSNTLSGPLLVPGTSYGFQHIGSAHFDGYFPFGFTQRAVQVLERLEAAYSFMAECTSHTPSYRLNVYVPSDPTSAGVAGGDSIWIWMDGFLWWNPDDPVNNWEAMLLHELGHQMEAFSYHNGVPITGTRNEALASVLAAEALDSTGDANKAQSYRRGECQWFLQHVEGVFPDTSPYYELLINRFLLHIYLPKLFGHSVHSRFFRDWIDGWRALADFSEADAFVTLYSFHCRTNLADAFQAIGYATTADKVYEGINRLEQVLAVDVTGDGKVDYKDLDAMSEQWLETIPPETTLSADLNTDKKVDLKDFGTLANSWLEGNSN